MFADNLVYGPTEPPVTDHPAYRYLASNLSDLMTLFDPSAVVLAGGMLNGRNGATAWMIDEVVRASRDRSGSPRVTVYHVFAGRDAGLVDAASLVLAANSETP